MKYTRFLPVIAFAWLNALGCIQVSEPDDDDDECDTNEDCASDRVCEDGECVERGEGGESARGGSGGSGTGGTGGSSKGGTGGETSSGGTGNVATESGCLASWEAASRKCSIPESYRQAVLDDCERRRAGQPAACLDEFDAGLACEASESAWTCNDSGQGSPTGCAEQIATHKSCLDANAGEGTGGSGATGGTGGTGGGFNPTGGTGGTGGNSACDDCLDTCSGLPSCCTGTGCICESSCRPSSDCVGTQTYCCGPDGFCFCTSNCPY